MKKRKVTPGMDATDLYYLIRRLRALVEPEIESLGKRTSLPQQIVLRDVFEFPGSTIKEVCERRSLAQSVVSKEIAEGRELGLVRTETDPEDRRRVQVFATEALKETVYEHLGTDVRDILRPATEGLADAEVEAIVDSLARLLDAVKRHDLPPIDSP